MATPRTSIRITTIADTLHSQEEIVAAVNAILDEHYTRAVARAAMLHPRYSELLKAMKQLGMGGGKRLRPYLAISVYEAYGGSQFTDICTVGAALELMHTAMLMHDDIIDNDFIRYGQENIAGRYQRTYRKQPDGDHLALSAALLAGDINLSAAYELVLESGFSAGQKVAVQTLLAEALFHVIGGELLDTDAKAYPPEETDPLDIAATKTAHYSFVTPLLAGAVLAGADEHELSGLTDFGMSLGIAYQLADDLLGVFGDETVTGKSSLGDIREGKRTWLHQAALQKATKAQRAVLEAEYGNPNLSEEAAESVRSIMRKTGAKRGAEKLIASYADEAQQAIHKLGISHESRGVLAELVGQATNRTK